MSFLDGTLAGFRDGQRGFLGDGNFISASALPPSGAAGGDLTGTYPNPTLAVIGAATGPIGNGTTVPVVTIDTKGRVTALTSTAITGAPPTGAAGGVLAGTYPNPTLAVDRLALTGGTMSGAIAMGANKITGLANGTVATDAAAFGQIPAALPPNGAAGGDLAGTYPNPTLAVIGAATGPIGNSTTVPVVTIDTKGRVTGLTSAAITGGMNTVLFTVSGNWTVPAGVTQATCYARGGSAGGGGGGGGGCGNAVGGGGGGGGASGGSCPTLPQLSPTLIPGEVIPIVIGAAGTGGAGAALTFAGLSGVAGASGTAGTATTFTATNGTLTWLGGFGGGGGAGGTNNGAGGIGGTSGRGVAGAFGATAGVGGNTSIAGSSGTQITFIFNGAGATGAGGTSGINSGGGGGGGGGSMSGDTVGSNGGSGGNGTFLNGVGGSVGTAGAAGAGGAGGGGSGGGGPGGTAAAAGTGGNGSAGQLRIFW